MFRIVSSAISDGGARIDTSTVETLGKVYGRTYTREQAEEIAADLRATVGDYHLPDSTEYTVVPADRPATPSTLLPLLRTLHHANPRRVAAALDDLARGDLDALLLLRLPEGVTLTPTDARAAIDAAPELAVRRRGRVPRYTERLVVLVTPETMAGLERVAERRGEAVPDVVRRAVLREVSDG